MKWQGLLTSLTNLTMLKDRKTMLSRVSKATVCQLKILTNLRKIIYSMKHLKMTILITVRKKILTRRLNRNMTVNLLLSEISASANCQRVCLTKAMMKNRLLPTSTKRILRLNQKRIFLRNQMTRGILTLP